MIPKGTPGYTEEERKQKNREYMRNWRKQKRELVQSNDILRIEREIRRLEKRLEVLKKQQREGGEIRGE